mgnify:CR=1 FL=1
MNLAEISPAEIVADLLERWGDPSAAAEGVVVGPTSAQQQQSGVVSVTAAGLPVVEKYAPLQWMRAQIRCLAPTLGKADTIAQSVQRDLHGIVRKKARMASSGEWYLVHLANITAGPSMHYDSPETWETLLFAEVMLGSQPL